MGLLLSIIYSVIKIEFKKARCPNCTSSFRISNSVGTFQLTRPASLLSSTQTHIDGIPLKDPQLQEEIKFDLPLLEELLHLSLGLIQLLQDALDVVDGAVMRRLIAGDSRVPAAKTQHTPR